MNMDVSEIYSPERVTKEASRYGLTKGFSLDLTVEKTPGTPWDFRMIEHRNEAIRMICEQRPMFIVGSPPCTEWSTMQNLNKHKWTQEERDERMKKARVHLEFMCKIYELQHKAGRYYIHEHPGYASSWDEACIHKTHRKTQAEMVMAEMCRFGMTTTAGGREGLARKATRFMTNSPFAAN